MNVLLILEMIMHSKCPFELQLDVYMVQRLSTISWTVVSEFSNPFLFFPFFWFFAEIFDLAHCGFGP